ncbi:MAG: DNA-binding response regulator [Candidatus Riflebacteria bacterium GWC2_50_8]|nr:MAG: DNA-binding response regulator [Candidatus Riflebacteria bacterium GWC2_50_8]
MKLLLVEDERGLYEPLSHILKKNGYSVDVAVDGNIGAEMAGTAIYDLIILDRMLPHRNGISILQELRRNQVNTPVLFLTAKDTTQDRIDGLDAGADDYLTKPFSSDELLARLRALSRRKEKPIAAQVITAGGLVFDPLRGEVRRGRNVFQLTAKESLLLELLLTNVGQVLTKQRIFEKIWGYYSEAEVANVDLYICYLRKKLGNRCIRTIRGVGYSFIDSENRCKHVS